MEDNGRGRCAVLAAGMTIQLCAGVIYMWSVFKKPVSTYLSWDPSSAALTSSVMLVCFILGMILGGKLIQSAGPRNVCIAGSVMIAAGFIASSFATSSFPELLYITYGIVGGLGVGFVYTTTVAVIQRWFFDRRGFATGMMVCAFGFSLVIFSIPADSLLDAYGVPATFRIFGVLFLVVCLVCSMLITFPPEGYVTSPKAVSISSQKQYTADEMLRTSAFYLITFSMFFVLPAYFILNPLLVTLGMDRGLTETVALYGVMITGACSASGRLVITWLSDRIGRINSLFLIIALTAVGIVTMTVAQGYLFLVCIAVISFAFGGASGAYATVTSDTFGAKNMGLNYGIVSLGLAGSALAFPVITKYISADGDYTSSFILAAATCVVSFVLVLVLRVVLSKRDVSES